MTDQPGKPRFRLGFLTHVQGRGDLAAARTKRIRLATAITILPLEHPLRLAEDVSVVDTLSGGRVEIGVGSGASAQEYAAFGRDRFHSFYGHPEKIVASLRQEKVLPLATDLITQFNPAVPDHDAAIRALELIATEIAPALGWKPAADLTGA